jgi:hypothetical protein
MKKYYVNKVAQASGDHEVHDEYCSYLPKLENRLYLGTYLDCKQAITKAKEYYNQVDGCYYCSNECHTR